MLFNDVSIRSKGDKMPDLIKEWEEKLDSYEADVELIDTEINECSDIEKKHQLRLLKSYLSALKRTVDNLSKMN